MVLAGIIIGSIALIVSFIVAWKTHLSPFRLELYCGSPRLEPMQVHLGNGKKVTRFAAILPLHFANTGARAGAIEDIMLKVQSDKYTWVFQPFCFTKFDLRTESTLGSKKLTEDPSNTPFHAIYLPGKEQIYQPIAFAPLFHPKRLPQYPPGDEPLCPGIYRFEIQVREMQSSEFKPKLTFNLELSLESVRTIEAGSFLIPFCQEIAEKRRKAKMWYS